MTDNLQELNEIDQYTKIDQDYLLFSKVKDNVDNVKLFQE